MISKLIPWTTTAPVSPLDLHDHDKHHDIEEKNSINFLVALTTARTIEHDKTSPEPTEELKHIISDLQQKLRVRAGQLTNLSHEKDALSHENQDIKKENDFLKKELVEVRVILSEYQEIVRSMQSLAAIAAQASLDAEFSISPMNAENKMTVEIFESNQSNCEIPVVDDTIAFAEEEQSGEVPEV